MRPAKPINIIAHVEGSGAAGEVAIAAISKELPRSVPVSEVVRLVIVPPLSLNLNQPFEVEPIIVGSPSPGRVTPEMVVQSAPVNVVVPLVAVIVRVFPASRDPMYR